jgi:hypothetical protein
MSNNAIVSSSHEEVWWTLHTDRDLLHNVLCLLRDERQNTDTHTRDQPSRIEDDVRKSLDNTNELIQALSAGHLLHETWRGQLIARHNREVEALGTISVRTYGDRVQQVRFRTNELICDCARLRVWQNL